MRLRRTQSCSALRWLLAPHRFGMTIHRNVGNISQNLGRAIAALLEQKGFRCGVDELGGAGIIEKGWMLEQVFDKSNVGGNASEAKLAQSAVKSCNSLLRCLCRCNDFDQQRIIMARDNTARVGRATI